MSFDLIREDLRNFPNWICWNSVIESLGQKPTKLPINPHTGQLASVTNPSTWGTFEQAVLAAPYCSGIGFVLTEDCPYSCIDLDDPYELNIDGSFKHDQPEVVAARQKAIAEAFNSYSEVSPSGKGLHIWVKGRVPSGRRREAVEIYSSGRYMTFTGQVFNPAPIIDYNTLLNQLWAELEGKDVVTSSIDKPQTQSDYDILTYASQAANGEKFIELYEGRFEQYYPSQSEADFALVDIISFYSQNREQITRIFRASALGKRDKAKRAQYMNYMLQRCFDRMLPEVDMDGLRNNLEQQLATRKQLTAVKEASEPDQASQDAPGSVKGEQLRQPEAVNTIPALSDSQTINISKYSNISKSEYTVPPGLVGEIAKFIHDAAPLPVPTIAIAGAIGLMAGVVGRSYNISGAGLNQYVLLLANTGTGKESCSSGIDKLMNEVRKTVPAANEFIGPAEIASSQALLKYISKTSKSFTSIVGEFCIKLQQISSVRANPHDIGLRRAFLDLYNKSGQGKTLGQMIYSDKDKNTETTLSPSFSIFGEGTPEKFYEILNKEMIEGGLLPRFLIIEYKGNRVQLNENHLHVKPSTALVDHFSALCAYSLQLNNGNNVVNVQTDGNSQQLFRDFAERCNNEINHASNDTTRQLWNRAHIKALKLAALLAVGCNYINPVINEECSQWALKLVVNDVKNLLTRFDSGEIGASNVQNEQTTEIKKAIRKYVSNPFEEITKYPGSSLQTWNLKVIPHSFISSFCRQRAAFKNDRLGPIAAIKTVLSSMIECDDIRELSPQDKKKIGVAANAKLYMVSGMKV